jgi:hypothetical protein
MTAQTDNWIDFALDDLAADDERASVPRHVESAVLREWEAQHSALDVDGLQPTGQSSGWRKAAIWALAPVAASAILAIAVLRRPPATPATPDRGVVLVEPPASHFPATPLPPPPLPESRIVERTPHRGSVDARPRWVEPGYVIVPDPFADSSALHVVRVRMARAALATLGMPVDPDAAGLVDLEVLVGDDGVARSIRKATFAGQKMDEGAER